MCRFFTGFLLTVTHELSVFQQKYGKQSDSVPEIAAFYNFTRILHKRSFRFYILCVSCEA